MNSPIGFILGSGWSKIADDLTGKKVTPFEQVFKRKTTVPGHKGEIIVGKLSGKTCIILSGRFHTYEGYSSYEATEAVRYLHKLGVKQLIITSAAGGLNPKYQVGDLVVINDIITLFCQSPLTGAHFQNMSSPFLPTLQQKALIAATVTKLNVQRGVYVYYHGPQFETFSDKMAFRFLGADVCGMSTVPETIMANHLGMEVLGLSLVTNLAFIKHDHKVVLEAVKNQEHKLRMFFRELLKHL